MCLYVCGGGGGGVLVCLCVCVRKPSRLVGYGKTDTVSYEPRVAKVVKIRWLRQNSHLCGQDSLSAAKLTPYAVKICCLRQNLHLMW